jgi:hypothetical protein
MRTYLTDAIIVRALEADAMAGTIQKAIAIYPQRSIRI